MSDVAVVIPWMPGCPYRDRARQWITQRWPEDWDVRTGLLTSGPWVKATAVENALQEHHGHVLVIADADVWADDIAEAVERVGSGRARWAVPHTLVKRLDEESTRRVISANATLGDGGLTFHRRPYGGVIGGGATVLRADDYAACPLDKRFVGWGQEDQAWGTALRCLFGEPWRARGDLWHLWHPPQHRMSLSRGSAAGWSLASRYWRAARSPEAMRALIAEIGTDTGQDPEPPLRETRGMWAYQNTRTGDIARFDTRKKRLDNLPNWILVEQPPVVEPITHGNGGSGAAGPVIADMVKVTGTGEITPPPAEPEPETARVDIPRPAAPKSEWANAAEQLGIDGATEMTKAQLVEAVRAAAAG